MQIPRIMAAYGALLAIGTQLIPLNEVMASSKNEFRAPSDPIALYGQEMRFDVLRGGREAGWHRVRFDRNGSVLTVDSAFHFQIDLLFLTVFQYRYEAIEMWRDGQLDRLTVKVDDDGTPFAIHAVRADNRLSIRHGEDSYSVGVPLYPTNHWNIGVLGENRVLNTLTGRVNRVTIRPVGRETVTTELGDVPATRYAYTGELETEVWYDDAGRWVKMQFTGRDGSTIEYVCRRCQGGGAKEAQH